ncbi:hypothetical protein [Micromonospora parva]|uniref:hypothetical protein n=1 Tax=Micromonospora parva TaxID=1464048 RepID=UPI003F4D5911
MSGRATGLLALRMAFAALAGSETRATPAVRAALHAVAARTPPTAVDHAAAALSHRCVQRIVDVQVDLDPYRGEPEVQELGGYVRHRLPSAMM